LFSVALIFFITLVGFLIATATFFALAVGFLVDGFEILGICINLVAGLYSAINTCQASLIHIKSMKC
jgi:hypothetical protein